MLMKKRLLFIFNPRSGKEIIKNKLAEILDIFAKSNMEIVVRPTQYARDGYETIKKTGRKFSIIIAAGGDGTLNECVNGLMEIEKEKRPHFGYIPTGTTNDFASSLGISKNPVEAAEGIFNGEDFWCDIGMATTGHFAYVAAFGMFTNVAYGTSQESKNMLGHMAYIMEGIKCIANIDTYEMQVEYVNKKGETIKIKDSFIFGMVSNTRSVAGMNLGNHDYIDLQDGLFEVVLIKKPNNPLEMQATINALLTKDMNSDRAYTFHASEIKFQGEKSVSWTLDGEFGGNQREMKILSLPREILMKVQERKATVFSWKNGLMK